MDDASTRQIGGKVAPCRLAPREALDLDAPRFGLGVILPGGPGQLLELQFQLIDEPLAALGARPEHRPLHLIDQQLQVLDQRLSAHELGTRLKQRRLQGGRVLGNMIGALDHVGDISTTTLIRTMDFRAKGLRRVDSGAYPAALGRQLCCGFLQSIPSSI
jgi:hypothetical protein